MLAINVPDRIIGSELTVNLADHLSLVVCLVSDNPQWLIVPCRLSRLTLECPFRLGIPARGQPQFDQLAELIHCLQMIAPTPTDAVVGFICMPLRPAPRAMFGEGRLRVNGGVKTGHAAV